jgi:hypothetical protein
MKRGKTGIIPLSGENRGQENIYLTYHPFDNLGGSSSEYHSIARSIASRALTLDELLMAETDRRLREDFLQHMEIHGAWPETKNFERWVSQQRSGIRHGIYAALKEGLALDPKYAVTLCDYFLNQAEQGKEHEQFSAFSAFLRQQGIENPQAHSPATLAQRLFVSDDSDFFCLDADGILSIIKSHRIVKYYVTQCEDEEEVREAIHWMFVTVGRATTHSKQLSIHESVRCAEQYMQIALPDYQARALQWWEFDRWTIIRARGKRAATGMSIVLPLAESAYAQLKNGRAMSYDILPTDLRRPSPHLLVEGTCERPVDMAGDKGNTTKNTFMAIVSQIAVLTHCHGPHSKKSLYLLSFAGTPRSKKRLLSGGFKTVGNSMPDSSIQFYERILPVVPHRTTDWIMRAMLWILGHQADEMLNPPTADE